ncbi:hypothetical protein PMIN06_002734 [Paraphaeosphaeria minitans]
MIVASKICCSSNENLRLESQPLDNFIDLGITYALMPKVRLNQHCAPLVTDGYTSLYIERQHNDSSTDICQEHVRAATLDDIEGYDYVYQAQSRRAGQNFSKAPFIEAGLPDYRLRFRRMLTYS